MQQTPLPVDHHAYHRNRQRQLDTPGKIRLQQLIAEQNRGHENCITPADLKKQLPRFQERIFSAFRCVLITGLARHPCPEPLKRQALIGRPDINAMPIFRVACGKEFLFHIGSLPTSPIDNPFSHTKQRPNQRKNRKVPSCNGQRPRPQTLYTRQEICLP
ncbi:hypothetical protein D3C84_647260 [compost metagenome]